MSHTITMIDYGGSNIRSVQKAFEFVGATVAVTAVPANILRADKLVLPGVGAFGAGMAAMRKRGLDTAVIAAAQKGTPLLGICLGMQLLFNESDEMGQHAGLGLIPGKVTRFPEKFTTHNSQFTIHNLKVPHMGWNQLDLVWEHPLLDGVNSGDYAYFVHSYYCDPKEATAVLAWTDYGFPFAAIAAKDNVFGLQFHPEKSQQVGLRIIQNFVEMTT
ncbi:MAG: imidazole glycerol phosphate synthase subunit HisH [Chloroflexi bacterium]|nr:imidazole glycerol phosphate synthase subunit HisH [Chloroflexota bacterium]